MEFQASEIADLIMVLVLGPIILIIVRRIAPSLLGVVGLCIALMASGYLATVLEGVLLPDFFDVVEHVSYALVGIGFVWLVLIVAKRLNEPKAAG